jgi:hydrogenase-4 component F
VSALLSGALLATSFYAILRYYQVAAIAVGTRFPQTVLMVFGALSLLLAALYVLEQYDLKRLLAYSSVEHMGILALGISFGVRIAFLGVLLHVLAHAAAKGNAFMGAGVLLRKFGTKELTLLRGGMNALPWSGPLFLIAIFALSALPPFGLFRSEFEIVAGGLADGRHVASAALVVLVTLAFIGMTTATTRVLYLSPPDTTTGRASGPPDGIAQSTAAAGAAAGSAPAGSPANVATVIRNGQDADEHARWEPSVWMVLPPLAGVAALVILGIHPPGDLVDMLGRAATELGAIR